MMKMSGCRFALTKHQPTRRSAIQRSIKSMYAKPMRQYMHCSPETTMLHYKCTRQGQCKLLARRRESPSKCVAPDQGFLRPRQEGVGKRAEPLNFLLLPRSLQDAVQDFVEPTDVLCWVASRALFAHPRLVILGLEAPTQKLSPLIA